MNELRNRLSIGHLMLWMATTSVIIAVGQWDLATAKLPANLLAEIRFRNLVWSLGFGPLQGMALAGVLIFLWRRFWSRSPLPTGPGHYLLITAGAERLMFLVTQCCYLLAVCGNESSVPPWANRISEIAFHSFPMLLAAIGAFSVRGGWVWRLSILTMGLLGAMTIFHDVALDWPFMRQFLEGKVWWFALRFGYSLPGILALVAAFLDWRHKQSRDFLHWSGVAVVVLGPVVEWLRSLLSR